MNLQIPNGEFDAFIFDCDGTLADTMPLHYRAWCAALAPYAVEFPEALFYELGGIPTPRIIEILNERHGHEIPVAEACQRKEALFRELIPQVRPIEPVVELVEQFHGQRPLAVASGGARDIVTRTLAGLGLLDKFQVIITAEDCRQGKPSPEPFLLAAQRLAVPPYRCLVFEDTSTGIAAAQAAGMAYVLVPPPRR